MGEFVPAEEGLTLWALVPRGWNGVEEILVSMTLGKVTAKTALYTLDPAAKGEVQMYASHRAERVERGTPAAAAGAVVTVGSSYARSAFYRSVAAAVEARSRKHYMDAARAEFDARAARRRAHNAALIAADAGLGLDEVALIQQKASGAASGWLRAAIAGEKP